MSVTITDCTIRDGGYLFNKLEPIIPAAPTIVSFSLVKNSIIYIFFNSTIALFFCFRCKDNLFMCRLFIEKSFAL